MKISITIKPNSKKGPLVEKVDDSLLVYVREPARENKANEALVKILAKHFNTSKSKVTILKGSKSHTKIVHIED